MTRADDYVKQGNTVTVTVSSPQDKGARKVRLQVIGDKMSGWKLPRKQTSR